MKTDDHDLGERVAALALAVSISHMTVDMGISARVLAKAIAILAEGLRECAIAHGGRLPGGAVRAAILVSTAESEDDGAAPLSV